MAQLAVNSDGALMRAEELSERTGIPRHYISKIMRRLVEAGLVSARKGHGGGFALARPATGIRFADILEALGFTQESMHCVFGWQQCGPENPCLLHDTWSMMSEAFSRWADGTTFADIKDGRSVLADVPRMSARRPPEGA